MSQPSDAGNEVQPADQPSGAAPPASLTQRPWPIGIAAGILLLGFFLPWINFLGSPIAGLDVQKFQSYKFVWALPILAVIALVLWLAGQDTPFVRRITGIAPFAVLAYAMHQIGGDIFKALLFGAWLSLAAGLALILLPGSSKAPTKG